MKFLLHVTHTSSQLWQKNREGWRIHAGDAPSGPVWVLTDLPEEGFAEIQVPRLFGRDRQTFLARQLASRFPDTPYRSLLPARSSGGLMERLAPPRQSALGLDAAKRLDAALAESTRPLAGVWLTSMLLATIGSAKGMPPELFVALPGPDALRLVVLKNRVPVLSRLIPGAMEPRALVAEIVRTVRHLENTRVLERSTKPRSLLMLGDAQGMQELLTPDNILIQDAPAPWSKVAPQTWQSALFDLVIASPVGQVAPLAQRTEFVASRLTKVAYGAAAGCFALGVWLGVDNMREVFVARSSQAQSQTRLQDLQAKIDEVDEVLAKFGVSADLVRQAAALDLNEIRAVRPFADDLTQLAPIVSRFDAVRLQQYSWRLLPPGGPACVGDTPVASAPTPPEGAPSPDLVEVNMTVTLPEKQRERAKSQLIAALSEQLSQTQGATLVTDPAKTQINATLKGGSAAGEANVAPIWCLTLPARPSIERHMGSAQ
jgi:hypothetical protein